MNSNTSAPFGHYKPDLRTKILLSAAKIFGFGKLKKFFRSLYVRRHDDTPVDIEYNGLKLRVRTKGNTIENRILFSGRIRERKELEIIDTHIKDKTVFVDIGANIGYYALNAAKMGFKRVVAIEPNPSVLSRFKDNIRLNDFRNTIRIFPNAIGEKDETLTLYIDQHDMGSSSIINNNDKSKRINVAVRPLIDILQQENITTIDTLKIDVEGMEDKALFPFFKTADQNLFPKIIIIEDNSTHWDENILNWLLSNGYTVHAQTRSNLILKYIS